ncbi:hypothetical protein D3C74_499460 [compost metagenome]
MGQQRPAVHIAHGVKPIGAGNEHGVINGELGIHPGGLQPQLKGGRGAPGGHHQFAGAQR